MSAYRRCAMAGMLFATAAVACDDTTTAPAEPFDLDETDALYLGVQELVVPVPPTRELPRAAATLVRYELLPRVPMGTRERERPCSQTSYAARKGEDPWPSLV